MNNSTYLQVITASYLFFYYSNIQERVFIVILILHQSQRLRKKAITILHGARPCKRSENDLKTFGMISMVYIVRSTISMVYFISSMISMLRLLGCTQSDTCWNSPPYIELRWTLLNTLVLLLFVFTANDVEFFATCKQTVYIYTFTFCLTAIRHGWSFQQFLSIERIF